MNKTILMGVAAAVGVYLLFKALPVSATVKTMGGAPARVPSAPDLSAYVGLSYTAPTPPGMVQTMDGAIMPASAPDLTMYGYG